MNAAVGAMEQMPMNEMTVKMLLETGSITKLLEAMRHAPNDTELLLKVVRVLGRMSINDDLKQNIVESGGIELVLWCMTGKVFSFLFFLFFFLTFVFNFFFELFFFFLFFLFFLISSAHPSHALLMAACCTALANFAFNSPEYSAAIVQKDGISNIENVMQMNETEDRVLANALQVLSNLMFQNDAHKKAICLGK